jgi:hypothetical protein
LANGSNRQISLPFSARSATTLSPGVVVYRTPSTMIGVA